jgi:WD40 repeat protein
MVMAVKLVRHQASQNILLLAGYEGGVTAVFRLPGNCTGLAVNVAQLIYLSKPHSQPILSLDTSPDGDFYFTSSADAMIAMHQIPDLSSGKRKHESSEDESSLNAEQHEYKDEEEAATRASPLLPDGPSDTPSDNQRMSLSHVLADSPSPSFAKQPVSQMRSRTPGPSNLSSALSSSKPQPKFKPAPPTQLVVTVQPPYKLSHTGHSGQQSLRVRSDGRLLVTGGWDWRIRIYSSKTLKEVAVLKWHEQGVYAVAFGEILEPEEPGVTEEEKARFVATLKKIEEDHRVTGTPNVELQTWLEELYEEMNKSEEGFVEAIRTAHKQDWFAELYHTLERKGNTLEQEREKKSKLKHWVAAGAKDGKVSLWEVF